MTFDIELSRDSDGKYKAHTSGDVIDYVTDADVPVWFGSMADVYQELYNKEGRWATNIFTKDPSPWGDKYKEFNYDEMRYHLYPVSARVIKKQSRPTHVANFNISNETGEVLQSDIDLSDRFSDTLSVSWNTT